MMKIAIIVCIYAYMGIHVYICIDTHILMSQQPLGDQ